MRLDRYGLGQSGYAGRRGGGGGGTLVHWYALAERRETGRIRRRRDKLHWASAESEAGSCMSRDGQQPQLWLEMRMTESRWAPVGCRLRAPS